MLPNLKLSVEQQNMLAATFHSIFSDERVDFSERLIALRKAQTQAIEEHGREGTMVVLEFEARLYMEPERVEGLSIVHYTEAPARSPWFDSRRLPLDKFVADVWKNFRGPFIATLQERCTDAFVLQAAGKWYLAYAFETSHYGSEAYTDFLAGREPELHPKFSKELNDLGWYLSGDLQRFYSVHGNFGELTGVLKNEDVGCIGAADILRASLNSLDAVAREDNWDVEYKFKDLLPICEDGSGNSDNLYKRLRNDDSYLVVSWDHETKELGTPQTLAEYIDQHFGNKMLHWG